MSEYARGICEIVVLEETEVPAPDQLSPLQKPGLRDERPVPNGVRRWELRRYVSGV